MHLFLTCLVILSKIKNCNILLKGVYSFSLSATFLWVRYLQIYCEYTVLTFLMFEWCPMTLRHLTKSLRLCRFITYITMKAKYMDILVKNSKKWNQQTNETQVRQRTNRTNTVVLSLAKSFEIKFLKTPKD
jgi:hypothetical protein